MKKDKKLIIYIVSLISVLLFLARAFFTNKMLITHDFETQILRTANYYLAIKQGQIPPRLAPNMNSGFGYPVFVFVYPLSHIVTTFLYMLGLSFELSMNVFMIIMILLAGLGMFTYSYIKSKSPLISFVIGLYYVTTPYMLINLFIRGAVGEFVFLAIFPWVLLLFEVPNLYKKWYFAGSAILIFSLLFMSHNLSLLVAVPILIVYFIYKIFIAKYELLNYGYLVLYAVLGLFNTAFYWIPMIWEKDWISGSHSVTVQNYAQNFVELGHLIYSPWGYGGLNNTPDIKMTMMLGFVSILSVVLSVWLLFRYKKYRSANVFWLIIYGIAVIMILPVSRPIWELIPYLKYLQFPWRLLWLTVVSSSILLLSVLKEKSYYIGYIIGTLVFIHIIYVIFLWAHPAGYLDKRTDHFWLEHPGVGMVFGENQPKNFNLNQNLRVYDNVVMRQAGSLLFDINQDKYSELQVLPRSNVQIWTGTLKKYTINALEKVDVLQKTAYYRGWQVWVDGEKVDIQGDDQEFPGRLIFTVNKGQHQVVAKFESNDSLDRKIADGLSIVGIFSTTIVVFWLLKGQYLFKFAVYSK